MRRPEPARHERKNPDRPDKDVRVPRSQTEATRVGERSLIPRVRMGNFDPNRMMNPLGDPMDDSEIYRPDPACDDFAM